MHNNNNGTNLIIEYLEDCPIEKKKLEIKTTNGHLVDTFLSSELIETLYTSNESNVHGLQNLTNTCYMNSVFQMLVKIPQILDYYYKHEPLYEEDDIAKEFRQFVRHYQTSPEKVLQPTSLVAAIKNLNSEYNNFRQNDSSALMDYIINHLHEDMEKVEGEKTYIHQHFFGEKETTITCKTCGNVSTSIEEFLTLNLPIPSPPSSLKVKVFYPEKFKTPTLYKLKVENDTKFGDIRETLASLLDCPTSSIFLSQVKYYDIDNIFSDDDMISAAVVQTILAYVIPKASTKNRILSVSFYDEEGAHIKQLDPQLVHVKEGDSEADVYDRVYRTLACFFECDIIDTSKMAGYFPYIKKPALPSLSESQDSIWGTDLMFSIFTNKNEPMGYHTDRLIDDQCTGLRVYFDDGFLSDIFEPPSLYKKFDIDDSILVPIEQVEPFIPTIDECLSSYLTPTLFQGNNKYFCEKCNKKVEKAIKEHAIIKLPSTLIITFTRFNYKYGEQTTKKYEKIGFPLQHFDLSSYCPSNKYDLIAVSNHNGGVDSGHYYTYTRSSVSSPWYLYNDMI
eukprot:CAMPEP_0117425564 /NCGR_PEP_ID=MMETSP0758-20121206/5820_1 /TAXON_ID=63605 /ORGANISM="Percolomonas cosmopolitus, Strain AE-1 (ATCC 50343)" /LENGTH=561 /DNA_ID=CAMNT_0005210143 /DNA_START=585 /DNA_END=2267 /DNA_ORIENTATION=+